jgi:flagellar hook protein FlgE
MPLSASLNVGVSALKSFAEGIQVTSNNISNVNTVGYKASRAQYSDTFSNLLRPLVPNQSNTGVKIPPTQIGGGVQIEAVSAIFSQGTIQTSANNSDLAIAGSGFFMVKDVSSGKLMATRAGNFRLDSDGYMVTQQGYRVQGAAGAKTVVEYNSVNKSISVKGPQDNLTVIGKSLNQELYTVELPSVEGVAAGMVVSGAGIPYGTKVVSISGNVVTLDKKPTITTTQPPSTSGLILYKGSPYAALEDLTTVGTFSPGQYLGAAGIPAGTVVSRVNKAAGSGAITVAGNTVGTVANGGISGVTGTGTGGLPFLTVPTAVAEKLVTGMRISSGTGASGHIITDVNVSTGVLTLSDALSMDAAGTYSFDPTITMSSPATDAGEGPKASISSNATAGTNTLILDDVSNLAVGMQVLSGKGAAGAFITSIDTATNTVTLSSSLTDTNTTSDAEVDVYEFTPSNPVWQSTYKFPALSFSNYYTPALNVGDVKISFDLDKDYDLVDTSNNKLSGLARAEAADLAPRIRTFNVGATGEISVILSNGQTFRSGYVLLQAFKDPGALIREGSNMFSGVDTAGRFNGPFEADNIENLIPGNRGLGAINGGGLELSNVDLGEEFSNMIITQRAFQAGSRVISTTDAMMEEVVNLKR